MKNNLATLAFALLAWLGISAQTTALQFDGVDDYLEAQSFPPLTMFNSSAFTVEITFKKSIDKPRQVLLAQSNRHGKFIVGINALGEPYTEIGGIVHEAQGVYLENDLCYHLSILYLPGTIDFYLNGQSVASAPNQSANNGLDQNLAFYIGQDYPNNNTTLNGEIDDMRIFADDRTQTEIQLYAFTELPLAVDNKFVYFSFNQMTGNHYPDPYYSNTKAWPGGLHLIPHEAPTPTEGHCSELLPEPESVSSLCQPMPTCNATGLPPGELLCNGNFEQYCSMLNGPQPSWVIPEHPFQSFGPPSFAGSDISNWNPINNTLGLPSSPDFYVRNGVGSPVNFHPVWPNATAPQWLQYTPTNTWNGIGNGVTGIISEANLYRERIYSDLNQNLSPNTTYQFSGWFYTTQPADPTWVSGAGNPGYITITFSDATGNTFITAGTVQIPHWDLVNNNNHWYFANLIFTTPPSLAPNISRIYVENTSVNTAYVFLDNLSLQAIQPTTFPQYINTGENNDSFHRRIKVDANDNVYVSGKISNSSASLEFGLNPILSNTSLANNRLGSFIAKYSSNGNLLWSRYIDNLLINDIEIMPNGNLFVVGETEALPVGSTATTPINWVQTASPQTLSCPGGNTITVDHTNTRNLFVMRVNAATGQTIGTVDAFGGMGDEIAVEVEIIGNTAYIAANVQPQDFEVNSATGPSCMFPNQGDLLWKPGAFAKSSSVLLTYDVSTLARDWFNNYTPTSPFKVLQKHTTDLVILTETGLQTLSTSNITNTASAINNIAASTMHVTSQGHIYLVQHGVGSMYHIVQRRLVSNLAAVNASKTYQFANSQYQWMAHNNPLSVCSKGSDVYILGQVWDFTNGNTIDQYYFEKLDLSSTATFGDIVWRVESNSTNVNYEAYISAGDWAVTQAAPFNNSSALAVVGNFHTQATNWQLNLPPKVMAGNNGSHQGNVFVAKIADNGSTGQYNKQANAGAPQGDVEVFPNPAKQFVLVRSNFGIQKIELFVLNGQKVFSVLSEGQNEVNIALPNLSIGLYTIKVSTTKGSSTQKLSIE